MYYCYEICNVSVIDFSIHEKMESLSRVYALYTTFEQWSRRELRYAAMTSFSNNAGIACQLFTVRYIVLFRFKCFAVQLRVYIIWMMYMILKLHANYISLYILKFWLSYLRYNRMLF